VKRLGHVIESLASITGGLSGWLAVFMMLLVLTEAFMRYVVGKPTGVADEFGAYALVALVYLGGAYTWQKKGHVRITALVDRLPLRVSSWLRLITLILALTCSFLLSLSSYNYLAFSFKLGLRSSTWVHTPLQWPQLTLPIGFSLLSLVLIVEISKAIVRIRSGRTLEEQVR
jgi:TRAP-type C4-dicarboxylate transport system permease small subunit